MLPPCLEPGFSSPRPRGLRGTVLAAVLILGSGAPARTEPTETAHPDDNPAPVPSEADAAPEIPDREAAPSPDAPAPNPSPAAEARNLVARLELESRTSISPATGPRFGSGWHRGIPDAIHRLSQAREPRRMAEVPVISESLERPVGEVSRSWLVNEFVFEMEQNFVEKAGSLLDEDLVLNGSRLFGQRWGIESEIFEARGEIEEMTAEERLVFRSGVEAIKDTLAQTDAYRFLYQRLQDVEVYLNWSIVHAEQDFSHVLKLYSAAQEEDEPERRHVDRSEIVSKLDSRFRIANLVEAPDEVFELRGKFFRHLHFSLYPVSQRFEVKTVLLNGPGYRLGLTYTEESGAGRMLVAGLTTGF